MFEAIGEVFTGIGIIVVAYFVWYLISGQGNK